MAIPFLNHLDLNQNELRNSSLHNTESTDITTPVSGQIIFDNGSGVNKLKYYDGSAWISLGGDTVRTVAVDTNGDGAVNNTLEVTETLVLKKGTNITLAEAGGIITISSTDTNTDTLQTIAADTANADRFITSVANASGAQTGLSHSTLKYNPSTETLKVTNLIVSGTSTTIDTETISLSDNIITLNSNATGTPSEDAGLEVERGDSPNVSLVWNEFTDRWTFTNNGTLFYDIPISDTQLVTKEADIDVSNSTFISNLRATINHALDSENVVVQMYDKVTGQVVHADVEHTSDGSTISKNHVRIEFGVVPANDIRVIMIDAKDAATSVAPSYS